MVIGDRRKFLSCLITLDEEAAERWAQANSEPTDALHQNDKLTAEIQTAVDEMNTQFAKVEQIKKFTVLERQFTIDDGELTPTLKVKRNVVNEHFADQIEGMYAS